MHAGDQEQDVLRAAFDLLDPQRTGRVAVSAIPALLERLLGRQLADAERADVAVAFRSAGRASLAFPEFRAAMERWQSSPEPGPEEVQPQLDLQLGDLQARHRVLAGKLQQTQADNEALDAQRAALTERLHESESESAALRAQLQALQATVDDLRQKEAASAAVIDDLRTEVIEANQARRVAQSTVLPPPPPPPPPPADPESPRRDDDEREQARLRNEQERDDLRTMLSDLHSEASQLRSEAAAARLRANDRAQRAAELLDALQTGEDDVHAAVAEALDPAGATAGPPLERIRRLRRPRAEEEEEAEEELGLAQQLAAARRAQRPSRWADAPQEGLPDKINEAGDTLHLRALDGQPVAFSGSVVKVNVRNWAQKRGLAITRDALFNLGFDLFGKPFVKKRVDLRAVGCVRLSARSREVFVVCLPADYDLLYQTKRRDEAVATLALQFTALTNTVLPILQPADPLCVRLDDESVRRVLLVKGAVTTVPHAPLLAGELDVLHERSEQGVGHDPMGHLPLLVAGARGDAPRPRRCVLSPEGAVYCFRRGTQPGAAATAITLQRPALVAPVSDCEFRLRYAENAAAPSYLVRAPSPAEAQAWAAALAQRPTPGTAPNLAVLAAIRLAKLPDQAAYASWHVGAGAWRIRAGDCVATRLRRPVAHATLVVYSAAGAALGRVCLPAAAARAFKGCLPLTPPSAPESVGDVRLTLRGGRLRVAELRGCGGAGLGLRVGRDEGPLAPGTHLSISTGGPISAVVFRGSDVVAHTWISAPVDGVDLWCALLPGPSPAVPGVVRLAVEYVEAPLPDPALSAAVTAFARDPGVVRGITAPDGLLAESPAAAHVVPRLALGTRTLPALIVGAIEAGGARLQDVLRPAARPWALSLSLGSGSEAVRDAVQAAGPLPPQMRHGLAHFDDVADVERAVAECLREAGLSVDLSGLGDGLLASPGAPESPAAEPRATKADAAIFVHVIRQRRETVLQGLPGASAERLERLLSTS